jgi:STE24 endopeptidase
MNYIALIILAALLLNYLLELISDALNLKALKEELPGEFREVYDADTYANSQAYTRERTRFGLLVSTFDLMLLLAFWFSGGFNWLDQLIRSLGYSPLVNGLIFITGLALAKGLINIPFSLYSTFVIEEKFGFNKTTLSTFFMDLFKGIMLGLLLGLPVIALVLLFFQNFGELAWLYAWIAVTLISLIIQFIAPTWIMPLFNKFEPLEDGELKESIHSYAEKVDFPLKGVFVMDGSKRSSKSNAFFTGFGKNKRIALFDTLIENHSVAELVAVLAHEVGHYKKKHILKNVIISILHTGVLFFLLSLFLDSGPLFDAFYMEEMSIYAGLIFFGLLYTPVELVLSIFMQISSRKHEFEADTWAAETIEDPEDMVNVLKGLSRDNLSNLTPHPFYVFLNYSHPPVLQRIKAIRNHE